MAFEGESAMGERLRNKLRCVKYSDGAFGFDVPEPSPEETAKRKQISARNVAHVKRRLLRNERLSGKTLKFALTVVGEDSEIGQKLKEGTALTGYERHLVIDVQLLHKRLGSI